MRRVGGSIQTPNGELSLQTLVENGDEASAHKSVSKLEKQIANIPKPRLSSHNPMSRPSLMPSRPSMTAHSTNVIPVRPAINGGGESNNVQEENNSCSTVRRSGNRSQRMGGPGGGSGRGHSLMVERICRPVKRTHKVVTTETVAKKLFGRKFSDAFFHIYMRLGLQWVAALLWIASAVVFFCSVAWKRFNPFIVLLAYSDILTVHDR